jgi:hypothetical protein
MCESQLREIPFESLETLQSLFARDFSKHFVILNTFKMLLRRVEKFPEIKQQLKIFALSDKWEHDGAFFATVSQNVHSDKET